jgi:ATP-dependent DNA ligase
MSQPAQDFFTQRPGSQPRAEAGSVLDGEIVVLDGTGRPELARLRERLAARDGEEAKRLAAPAR